MENINNIFNNEFIPKRNMFVISVSNGIISKRRRLRISEFKILSLKKQLYN